MATRKGKKLNKMYRDELQTIIDAEPNSARGIQASKMIRYAKNRPAETKG